MKCAFTGRAKAAPGTFEVDRLLVEHPFDSFTYQHRAYRADALVTLLGITVYSRAGVGSGFASYREARRSGATVTTARFGGGSFPARAHNLNRLGFIQEVVVEGGSGPLEAAYFGFMTSSPEESLGEAKRSLERNGAQVPYVAAEGHLGSSRFHSSTAHFAFPSQYTWSDRGSLLQQVRSRFSENTTVVRDLPVASAAWPGTLLYRVANALKDQPEKVDCSYVYNAKQFHLTMEKSNDPRMASALRDKGLTSRPDAVALYRGIIHHPVTGKNTKFRLWAEKDGASILPLRIELQARSFLSLAFEYDPKLETSKEIQEI